MNFIKINCLVFLSFFSLSVFAQPSRNKAVDLTNSEGHHLIIGDENNNIVAGKDFTYETWIKVVDNSGKDFTFFDFWSGGSRFSFVLENDKFFRVEVDGGYSGERSWKIDNLTSSSTFTNKWMHVVMAYTRLGNNVAIYVNGSKVYQSNLLNNSSIKSLLKDNGKDYKWRIGGESEDGSRGKAYLADLRIWNKRLSHDVISTYWDEAVNKSHPDYSNLVRYYPLNSDYISSGGTGIPRFEDHVGNYNAKSSSSSLSDIRVRDQYPIVKPARFDSGFNLNFTANDCQTSAITVSWYNLRGDNTYSPVGTDVWYELVREDNPSNVLYSGTNTSFTDNSVNPGDKHRYRLRTVWKVNGYNYYSDYSAWSDFGTVKEQYDAPSSITATTENCDESIDISWSSSATPPRWLFQASTNSSDFSSRFINRTFDGTTNNFTAENQTIETNLFYRVRAYGTDDNGCAVTGEWSPVVQGFTSKPPSLPANGSITQDLANKKLIVDWDNINGNNADSWIIKRTKFDGSDEVEFTTALGTTIYEDADLQLCKTYSYTLGAVNECAADGVFATTDLTGNISADLSAAITSTTASKGYLPDGVQVEWAIDGNLSNIDRFRLYRSRADQNNFSLIKILDNDLIYTDETALGSTFYNYKVVGESTCENNIIYTNEGIDMGFVIPYGVANGHIEYDGGNPVEGVTVTFEKSSGNSGKSLRFDTVAQSYIAIKDLTYEGTGIPEMMFECWLKTDKGYDQVLASFDRNEYWRVEINGESAGEGQIGIGMMTDAGQIDFGGNTRIDDNEWHHIATTYKNGELAIYIDGVLDASTTHGNTFGTGNTRYGFIGVGSEASIFNSQTGPDRYFTGLMDEIKIWEKAKSAEEIARDYNRILNGSEEGLLAYWRCDEGVGNHIYDASKVNDVFNKHDAQFFGNITYSNSIPNSNQLGIRGITNEFGDYTVSYIPYKSGGEIFKVTPALGQHAFEPSSRTVFVGDGAQTQNGLDFKDISSFTVQGKVTYKNTNVPVQGVSILIDGQQAVGADNQPVRTDNDGNYEINVPIGFHYLSTQKDGHVFNEGFFPPKNAFGDVQTFEFTEDLIVNFTDSTTVKVAGRVVGGNTQAQKKLGFNESVNNVGVADLRFSLQNDAYNYPDTTISTDPYSGEYTIELIPEPFIIGDITTEASFSMFAEDIPVLDLTNSLTPFEVTDTTFQYNIGPNGDTTSITIAAIDTFIFHHNANYIFFENPTIEVTEVNKSGLLGDTIITFVNQVTGGPDTLIIDAQSGYQFPVFQMGKSYRTEISVNEVYSNPFHPDGAITDYVSVENAEVTVTNKIMVNPSAVQGKTNKDGVYAHTFIAGQPSLSADGVNSYTKTFEVNISTGKGNFTWDPNNTGEIYRAYVLGSKPLAGTDFLTYGPEVPEIVLRDPPGDNSYAYIEKGASYSTTQSWTFNLGVDNALDYESFEGSSLTSGSGILITNEFMLDNNYGTELRKEFNLDGSFVRTVTFKERIETSADPENVGSDADVYIGRSYNVYMSKSKNLKPMPKKYAVDIGLDFIDVPQSNDSTIVFGIIDGVVVDDTKDETYFMYTQKHILYELIPTLLEVRDNLFLGNTYTSNFPANSRYFGMDNDDPALAKFKLDTVYQNPQVDTANISYIHTPVNQEDIDSVALLNQQIKIWLNTIALNEIEKVNAEPVRNISIDGSAGPFTSSITEEMTSAFNYERVNSMKIFMDATSGIKSGGKGFELNTSFGLEPSFSTTDGQERTNSIEFGYVIDDTDEGDYYSIDVLYDKGAKFTTIDNFTAGTESREDFWKFIGSSAGIGAGNAVAKVGAEFALQKLVKTYTKKATYRKNAYITAGLFASDMAFHLLDAGNMLSYRESIHKDMDKNGRYDVTDFAISSPIFKIRGGQTKCPYEGEEYTSFIRTNSDELVKLNTATLQREIPVLEVEPSIRSNVPESEEAQFTLKLQNLSESESTMWYDIQILEETNPDGLALKIDGLSPNRSFLVPALSTVEKTLKVSKTKPEVMEYDSIGIMLKSTCQHDATNAQADIADTVYISVKFLPECSKVDIKGDQNNWIINYSNNNEKGVVLNGYDLNRTNLESIAFQYKTTSGTPITYKKFFKDTASAEYVNYTGEKALLDGGESDVIWNVENLNDRKYQIRAISSCTDGSVFESDYYEGIIDRINPTAFGTPEPADGVLDFSDDIMIRFNEEIEAGLVRDFNFSVRSVLNGADIAHGTSVAFNGNNEFGRIPSVSLNNKSFTFEYWLRRDAGTAGTAFSKGSGNELLELTYNADESLSMKLGTNTYPIDPTAYYTTVTPVNSWHHWAVSYDNLLGELSVFIDGNLILTKTNLQFAAPKVENVYVGRSANGSDYLACEMHELRIWDEVKTGSEIVAQMNITQNANTLGLYGYWPMNEGKGEVAFDESRARHMALTADWNIRPGSYAFAFDGASQYLSLDGSNVVIDQETDFTIEFWFKANTPSSAQTIFSSGRGDLSDTLAANPDYALAINALPSGAINVVSNGASYTAVSNNYFDNRWHHFALTVNRGSTTKAYVDGALQTSSTQANIAGIAGSKLWLGARGYKTTPQNVTFDQYFNGTIDEFRVWNSNRTAELIDLYSHTKLNGDEAGLIAYLPFETYQNVQGTLIRNTSLSDEATPMFLTQASPAVANSAASFVAGAAIKDVRPAQDIPFEFVVNNDEIFINPLIDANRIEGQILEISVSSINDLNGNQQLSTESWTAFVQQNVLVWQESNLTIDQTYDTGETFTATITNKGGLPQSYTLDNMPLWLTADALSGSVQPNSTKQITFTIDDALNIGNYNQSINLSTALEFDEPLNLTVNVLAESPNWIVDSNKYQHSMNVFGRLIIEGVVSTDENDKVAAFVNGEPRGVANVEYLASIDEYRVFLTIFGNVASEDIEFRVWNASEGKTHGDVTPTLNFAANAIVGTPDNPIDIEASDLLAQTFELNQGWNWISFNLISSQLATVDSVFNTIGQQGDLVKTQLYYDIFDNSTGWLGTITMTDNGFQHEKMYKVFVKDGGTFKYAGSPVDPLNVTINVQQGWNYIGFTPQTSMPVTEALANLNPQAGDVIKSQNGFAMYSNALGWFGSLTALYPNEGYMLYSTKQDNFNYPDVNALAVEAFQQEMAVPEAYDLNVNAFETNMPLVAQIEGITPSNDDVLSVKIDGELRGYAQLQYVTAGKPYYFISVQGEFEPEQVSFELAVSATGEVLKAENVALSQSEDAKGNLENPFILNFSPTSSEELESNTLVNVYPNPFNEVIQFQFPCQTAIVKIIDAQGGLVFTGKVLNNQTISISDQFAPGVYFVELEADCITYNTKIIKQN